jgi:hypothetical protein
MIAAAPVRLESLRHGLPNICGWEQEVAGSRAYLSPRKKPRLSDSTRSAFACALHMHQPTIPGGRNGDLISNLQAMFDNPGDGDNHNAAVFAHCYGRMGDLIPQLRSAGANPRIMLDYSGNLLWGLEQMGRWDVLDKLKDLVHHHADQVEWLGTMWSHAVVPSTPIPDIKLHIQAWQQHFAGLFGWEALARVRGFSPPEMHLPNHPDVLYEYIKALRDCGYEWLLVQEHSVENADGSGLSDAQKYGPNRLVARNGRGEEVSITALIKTQGSDTKLVGQMQPYFEAKGRDRLTIADISIPSMVSQIADGENGGVMMNEFPRDFVRVYETEIRGDQPLALNGSEYLDMLADSGLQPERFPVCQAVQQHRIWNRMAANPGESLEAAIAHLKTHEHLQMDGASWTNDLSWVQGYDNVLGPMNQLSAAFHQRYDRLVAEDPSVTLQPGYQKALLYNLLLQTSCFRYWGQGTWTDYAQRLFDQGMMALVTSD